MFFVAKTASKKMAGQRASNKSTSMLKSYTLEINSLFRCTMRNLTLKWVMIILIAVKSHLVYAADACETPPLLVGSSSLKVWLWDVYDVELKTTDPTHDMSSATTPDLNMRDKRERVARLAAAMDGFPAQAHFLQRRRFGVGADKGWVTGTVRLAERVATGCHGGGFLVDPTAAIYLDEQAMSVTSAAPDVYPIDLARVEALAGPQSTLYGASSQSGAVRVITNKPDVTESTANVGFGLVIYIFIDHFVVTG